MLHRYFRSKGKANVRHFGIYARSDAYSKAVQAFFWRVDRTFQRWTSPWGKVKRAGCDDKGNAKAADPLPRARNRRARRVGGNRLATWLPDYSAGAPDRGRPGLIPFRPPERDRFTLFCPDVFGRVRRSQERKGRPEIQEKASGPGGAMSLDKGLDKFL